MNLGRPKLIVFDLDGTLAESKQALTPAMAASLRQLLDHGEVAVISGAEFPRMLEQLVKPLQASEAQLVNLHILPSNGTHYFRFDFDTRDWQQIYGEDIPADDRKRIFAAIEQAAKQLRYWEAKSWGPIIEDRGGQVTYSALGQQAPLEPKSSWDPDGRKRRELRQALLQLLPEFEVRTAGLTSIDITLSGTDKASAITKLKDVLGLHESDIVYVGDAMTPGGNDAVVREAGFKTVAVTGPAETLEQIKQWLG